MRTIGIIVALLLFVWLARRSLRLASLTLIASLPLYLVRVSLGPVPTTFLEIEFAVLFVAWCMAVWRLPSYKQALKTISSNNTMRALGVAALLLALGGVLGFSQSQDLFSTLNIFKSYIVEPIVFACMLMTVEIVGNRAGKNSLDAYAIALAIPTIVIGLWALFQAWTGITLPPEWYLERRATSIFPYPNAVAHFAAPVAAFLFAWLLNFAHAKSRLQCAVIITALLLALAGTVTAQSEAAIAALAVVFALTIAHRLFKKSRASFTAFACIVVILVATVVAIPQTRARLTEKLTLSDWSGQTRVAIWKETGAMLTASPKTLLLGVGMNNYPAALQPYHRYTYLEVFQYPHNILLNIWVELGVVGVLGFLLLAVTCVRVFWKHPATLPAAAALLAMTIHGLVDVPYFKNDLSFLTWIMIALLTCAAVRQPPLQHAPVEERLLAV